MELQQVDKAFVHLARQHHLDDIHGLFVRDPQAVDEFRRLAQLFHQLADLRPAAVDQHHLDADEPQQDDILHHLLLQLLADHGVAAVFDHHRFARVALDIRQRLGQYLRAFGVG